MQKSQQGATNAIILNDNNQILFTERSSTDDYFPGYWELPGGGMEYGETPQEGLKREILEECGIEIEIIKPIDANTYFINELQRIEITFLCKAKDTKVKLSHEHTKHLWLDFEDINTIKISSYVEDIINRFISSHT